MARFWGQTRMIKLKRFLKIVGLIDAALLVVFGILYFWGVIIPSPVFIILLCILIVSAGLQKHR